jgi:CPA2 family monovalent cation:H+ antiporter-2
MHGQQLFPHLREILLFLLLAGVLVPLLQRFRINQMLGFLAAGVVVGPFGLALWSGQFHWLGYFTFSTIEDVAPIAELGILFLMFMIGLDLSPARLWALRKWVFGAGLLQIGLTAALIGSIAWLFGNRIETAIVLGLALSLSSTAVAMQLLSARRAVASPLGQASFSILMMQDLAVVPLFILIGVLAQGDAGSLPSAMAMALAKAVGTIVLAYLIGRRVMRPVFTVFAVHRQPETFTALTLLVTLGIAAATAAAGLSMALGAFLAGLLLADTEFKHEVEVTVEPFKGLLMGLFFMSVGMQVDVRVLVRDPLWIPLSVLGLFAIKAAITAIVLRLGRFGWGSAIEGGLLLGQGGEFAFIIAGYAVATRLMDGVTGQFMMIVVGLSMFVSPAAARFGSMCADWFERRQDSPAGGAAPPLRPGHVVIAGFGRVGQLIADILQRQGIEFVALERDHRLVSSLHSKKIPVFSGDASRAELLHKVHAQDAAAVVLTMDDPQSALHAVRAIRKQYPALPLYARARDEKHARLLKKAGATQVIPETLESGLQLAGFVLHAAGAADGEAAQLLQAEREERIARLDARLGDIAEPVRRRHLLPAEPDTKE